MAEAGTSNRPSLPAALGGEPVRSSPLPFYRAPIPPETLEELRATLESGWLTTGPRVRRFEERLRELTGARALVATSSCTAALHLALVLSGVGPGDEVITTPLTFCSTVHAILHVGARPVFADVEADTLLISPEEVARRIGPHTRAVIAVDYGGHPADYPRLREVIGEAGGTGGIALIADCAHNLEGRCHGKPVAQLADYACYSFYATKNLTTGEGGALALADPSQEERARRLLLHGMESDAWKRYSVEGGNEGGEGDKLYEVYEAGFKYNLPELAAALGLVQLRHLGRWHQRRRELVLRYRQLLSELPEVELLAEREWAEPAYHLMPVLIDFDSLGMGRRRFMEMLRAEGIHTSVHFTPVHQFHFYRQLMGDLDGELPVASEAGRRLLSLPLFPEMGSEEVEQVVQALDKVIGWAKG